MSDDVAPFSLQVGSRWPAHDADNLIQITLIQRGRMFSPSDAQT